MLAKTATMDEEERGKGTVASHPYIYTDLTAQPASQPAIQSTTYEPTLFSLPRRRSSTVVPFSPHSMRSLCRVPFPRCHYYTRRAVTVRCNPPRARAALFFTTSPNVFRVHNSVHSTTALPALIASALALKLKTDLAGLCILDVMRSEVR